MLEKIENCIYQGYKEKNIRNNFTVKESNIAANCRVAKFKKSGNILVYKFDKNPKRNGHEIKDKFPFFEEIPKLKAICDFVFFYQKTPQKLFIVLCNLKSGTRDNSPDQLEAGKIFSEFIINNVKRLYPIYTQVEIKFYEVLFSSKLLYKIPTNPKNHNPSVPRNYISNSEQIDVCDLDNLCRH